MGFPFELPVKKKPDSKEFEGLWVVVDNVGMIIGFPLKDFEADYIVQAINSHEKLIEALKELRASDNWLNRLLKSCVIFLDDGDVTKRAVEKQSRYNQQALNEAENK